MKRPKIERASINRHFIGLAGLTRLHITVDVLRSPWLARGVAAHEAGHHVAKDTLRLKLVGLVSAFAGAASLLIFGLKIGVACVVAFRLAEAAWHRLTWIAVEKRADRLGSEGGARVAIARLNVTNGTPEALRRAEDLHAIAPLIRAYLRVRSFVAAFSSAHAREPKKQRNEERRAARARRS